MLCWFQVPIIIPILVLVISTYLIVAPIIDAPQIEYLYACSFIVAGLIFYIPFVLYKFNPPVMSKYYKSTFHLYKIIPFYGKYTFLNMFKLWKDTFYKF